MLVELDDAPDVVAFIPTLGADTARLAATVQAVKQQSTPRRLAIVCILNAPVPSDLGLGAHVSVVTAGLNLGWPGGLSFGRSLVSAPYLWFVQDDMRPRADCLDELLRALERDDRLGLVCPIDLGDDGRVAPHSCGGILDDDGVIAAFYPPERTRPVDLDRLDELSWFSGRGSLARATAWDAVGGMDPRYYPIQLADADFSYALRQAGYAVRIVPTATLVHDAHSSTSNDYAMFLLGRNAEYFIAKWFPGSRAAAYPAAPPRRPNAPAALTGTVDPRIPSEVLAAVAQASADTLLHLARNYSVPSPPAPAPPSLTRRVVRRARRVLRQLRQ